MAAQHFYHGDIWQDVRLYLAEAPTSHDKSIKITASLLIICLLSHLPTTLGAVAAQNNRQSPTLCRLKLFFVVILMFFETLNLFARYTLPSLSTTFSPAVAALNFFLACATFSVIDISAKRPFSRLPACLFLLFGTVSSFSQCQSYYQTHLRYFASASMLAGCCCRVMLLVLQMLPGQLVPKLTPRWISPYISWYEELTTLLQSAFFAMFRAFPSPDSVQELELELDPHPLSEVFSKIWRETDERSKNRLFTVCVRTVSWLLFLGILPHLLTTAVLLSQPLLLKRIIVFVGVAAPDSETRWTLVMSVFIICFGSAVSRACYHHLSHRMHVALRGALLLQIFQKIHRLGQNQAKLSAARSLIGDDVSVICAHLQLVYQFLNDTIYIVLGFILMWILAGRACLVSTSIMAMSVIFRVLLQSSFLKAQSDLAECSRKRLDDTRSALSQLPLIKMLGLRSVVVAGLYALRRTEVQRIQAFFDKRSLSQLADVAVDVVTPTILSLGFYLTTDRVAPEKLFPSLALSVHLQIALHTSLHVGGSAVSCVELAISPEGREEPVLQNIHFHVEKGAVTVCIGPGSSGKSTFLQALAGQANILEGSLFVNKAEVAYCDQDPYLANVSIRDNITAGLDFDSERYDLVLRLCLLHHDIEKLDEGDAYATGDNGVNLSRGQRHRVALARALYSQVETVVIDDLFGSLDRKSATSILYLLCGKDDGFLRREKRTVFFSTYLVDCFDITDQVLIFDGLGNAMLRNNTEVDPEFRNMLEGLSSPRELNPEEEDHKQLAGILRSRRIRKSFNATVPQPMIRRYDPLSGIPVFDGEFTNRWPTKLVIMSMFFITIGENVTEYLTPIWVDFYPNDIKFPLGFVLVSLITAGFAVLNSKMKSRIMIPNNAKYLDETISRKIFSSTLAYLGAVDQDNLLQQVSSFVNMAGDLPAQHSFLSYMIFHVLFRSFSIISGVRSGIALLPLLGISAYSIVHFNRRSSRQLQHFSTQAEKKLGQRFLETVNGVKHTRAFGRLDRDLASAFEVVDTSQRCHALECLALAFSRGEMALADAHDLRDAIQNIPMEDHQSGIDVPASWPEHGEVIFENVTASYSTKQASNPALRGVSLAVGPGEKLAIAGRTGSGKSSLLLALLGFLHYEGTIKIDGIDISTINRDALRSRVITLTYDPLQLPTTVRKNLLPFDFQYSASGDAGLEDETLCRVLSDLGIWKPISRQGGLNAYLPTVQLSRSEMQLFGIARAIMQRMGRGGKLILMDEATSALDAATDKRIQGALAAAFPGCTFMIITHRQITIRDAEKFLELQDGAVASFIDTRQVREEDVDEARVSYNQLAESAGGGTLEYKPPG
ncbi:hypothetical protein LMH87_003295 [Akanthomyces muscarius]|uniref:ABC transporter n=1 Tax=Akanthomyces muscarius TaxID=2231603 RepID=A0A9W8Q162_AKAMU|nr:hypothetical protein LMH87_003295 [Akanthomyces muscarius]KAJ4144411.1 hypothetical protein LMH87_003295 [Akanthomyces muscarius]